MQADYIATTYREILQANDLTSFDAFWKLRESWVEAPNQRRGGWSGVARCVLKNPAGGTLQIFLKSQENHRIRDWRHPIRGVSTFEREFQNIRTFQAAEIPTTVPIYFAQRRVEGALRAVLVTEALDGFTSLNRLADQAHPLYAETQLRWRLLTQLGLLASRMHANRIKHCCFYPKHLFAKLDGEGRIDLRVLDLEKARPALLENSIRKKDLGTLSRKTPGWSRTDHLRFLRSYLGVDFKEWKQVWKLVEEHHTRQGR